MVHVHPLTRRVVRRMLVRTTLGAIPVAALAAVCRSRQLLWSGLGGAGATAAALERRPGIAGVGIAGVGATVVTARSRRGAVTAAAVGAASTLATAVVVAPLRHGPARAVPVAVQATTHAVQTGHGLVVVANPAAGGDAASELDTIRDALPDASIVTIEPGADVAALARRHARSRDVVAIGVLGGDGTVSAVAGVAVELDLPLAVFPGGTRNHFARDLDLHTAEDTLRAMARGSAAAVDVADIDGHLFLNNASVGSYVDFVDERDRLRSTTNRWWATWRALVHVLRNRGPIELALDGEEVTVWLAFFGNSRYEPADKAPTDRPALADGLLDLRVVDASGRWSRVRLVLAVATGALARSRVHDRRCVASVTVTAPEGTAALRVAADGETFDASPSSVVRVRPTALVVYRAEEPSVQTT